MKTSKTLFLFLLSGIGILPLQAQHKLTGKVYDEGKQILPGVVLSLQQDTVLIGATLTDGEGSYIFEELKKGKYRLIATCLGLETQEVNVEVNSNVKQDLVLEQGKIQLDEVVVTADKSQVVIPRATGTTFHLSQRAKSVRDPYEALLEIPKLTVTPSSRSLKLADGTVPLILVNGNRFNGGVESIDPKNVEAIEIIENPSARYLKEGVEAIVNFKVKKPQVVYHRLNIGTKHSVPVFYGNSNAYYETGNAKASLSVTAQHWYFHDDDTDMASQMQNVGYRKQSESSRRWNSQNVYLSLNGDWICSPKDYLALNITYINNPSEYKKEGQGKLFEEGKEVQDFTLFGKDKVSYYINSYNLYYKHSFTKEKVLETTARFNLNGNTTKGMLNEDYSLWTYDNAYDYDNFRYSGGLEVNYSAPLGGQTVEVGSDFSFLKDRVRQVIAGYPTFYHRNLDEYVYAGISGSFSKRFSYVLSAGCEMLFRRVSGIDYDYIKPAGSLNLNYRFNTAHSLSASYRLTHKAPSVGQLNPYNTSTDSLVVTQGNPFLLPSQRHQWELNYAFSHRGLYIEPVLSYTYMDDMVEKKGYTRENGVYVSTYENSSRFSSLSGSINLRYNSSKWGGFGLGIENLTQYYEGQSAKNSFIYTFNFYGWYKRLSWNGNMWYSPKDYGVNYKVKNRGAESECTLTYKLDKHFSCSVGLRYWLGTLKTDTSVNEGTYSSVSHVNMKERSYKVLFGISYGFQKQKSPNRAKKYLNSKESGIQL